MKSICVALVSLTLLCPLVVHASPTELAEPLLERYREIREKNLLLESCATTLSDDLRPIALEIGGWVLQVFNRTVQVIELRRSCDAIEMSDPPTRWELIQREACELVFHATVAFEITRLTYEITVMIQTYPPLVRQSIDRFLDCVREEVPEFYSFNQCLGLKSNLLLNKIL